jgi:Zn-finger nucleic acid-binding protein
MRQYERSGVHVDQCSDCRGIFLDRGELERLVDAETSWARAEVRTPDPRTPAPPAYGHDPYHGKPYKRRKSFLEELFD